MSTLHKMFAMAQDNDILAYAPRFPRKLEEPPARKGYFEAAAFLAVR